jgi:DNA-binding transcriptional LysR family regulator
VDLRQLEYFLATADHGGISRAATALKIPQPSLSDGVRALEREVGTILFHRVGRGMILTSAGHALLGPARRALRDVAAARASVDDVRGITHGHLDLLVMNGLMQPPITTAITAFRTEFPQFSVHVGALMRDEEPIADQLASGRYEVALTYLSVPEPDLEVHELAEHRVSVAFPPGQGTGLPEPLPLAALSGVPTVVVRQGGETSGRAEIARLLVAAGVRTRPVVVVDNRAALLSFVIAGVGATFLVGPTAEARARGAVVRTLDTDLRFTAVAVHRASGISVPAQAFVRGLTARFAAA